MPVSLRARIVYPIDRPPLEDGVVTIDGEQIVAIEVASRANGPIRDLGEVALLPGFVNAHTHLEFSHLRAPLGRLGMPLVEWLPLAIAERQNRSHTLEKSIALGTQESLLAGTCAIGEIATTDAAVYPTDAEVALTPFLEAIGFSRARAVSAFAAVRERLAKRGRSSFLGKSCVPFSVGLSPHAPYTVSPELVGRLVYLAGEQGLPLAMHLAESAEEIEFLSAGAGPFRDLLDARSMWDPAAIPLGSRPLDYLRLLADAPRALVIHGNYLARDEHEFLAARADRMTLVYCPRTHAYFQHPPYPLAELLVTGVHVALGTDSRASNPDLNMLGEVRHVARMHPAIPAEEILRMATLSAAQALGCEQEFGSITPGKLANLVALPLRSNSLDEIVAGDAQPTAIWLRGREV
jgi:cytosine/adenosine deaminase-related metal-dependent hydrolase